MPTPLTIALKRHAPWALAWLAGSLLVAVVLGRLEISRLQDAFDAEVQSAYALLGQRLPANDALLASLAQGQLAGAAPAPLRREQRLEQRLTQTHPQVLAVSKREADASWGDEGLRAAEVESVRSGKPVLANVNLPRGRYSLVLAAEPASHALHIDLKAMVPWQDWPMVRVTSPVRVTLSYNGQQLVLQEGAPDASTTAAAADSPVDGTETSRSAHGWPLRFSQSLPSASQPFVMQASRTVAWGELPWGRMFNIALLLALALLAARALLRQRHDRLRAAELLHLGQAGRLNTLTELAAGMTRELEAPLQQALAGIQAAEQELAHEALQSVDTLSQVTQARQQLQHATGVVDRLRHVVRQPDLSGQLDRISLLAAVRHALDVLQPELRRLGIAPKIDLHGAEFTVLAEHGALQQVIHNLLLNALQAMEGVRPAERRLTLGLTTADKMGRLLVQDNGPGMDNRVVARIFEPFFTTRPSGLGLGLSLCESLTTTMGGTLTAFNRVPRGAEFCLSLRLAH